MRTLLILLMTSAASAETGDSGIYDTGASDTGASDTGASDTGSSDTGASDTGASDTGASDTGDTATYVYDTDYEAGYTATDISGEAGGCVTGLSSATFFGIWAFGAARRRD